MKNIMSRATLLVILSFGTLSSLHAQEKSGESRDLSVRNEIHRQFHLAPNSTVDISVIPGPVEIETTNGEAAEINIVNTAETQADLKCLDSVIEQTPGKLVIQARTVCKISRVSQRVTMKAPRNVNLDLKQIAGNVRIGPTNGMIRMQSIAGHVSTSLLQNAEMSSLAQGLSMEIKQIDDRGVRLSSIVGGIELALSENLNAQFAASSIIGDVMSDIPAIKLSTDDHYNFAAQIGSGGPPITVSSVRGGIRLRKLD